jgi:hypothetical protein
VSLSARDRLADMWTIARGRRPRYAVGEPDDEPAPDLEGGLHVVAVACGVVASAALGGTAGWLIPEPYLHPLVDWLLYTGLGAAAAVALGSVADAESAPMVRALAVGALASCAFGAAGLLFGWSAYDTVFAAWVALLGGMAVTIAPVLAAISFALGAAVAFVDLAYELARGRVETFGEGFGLVVRETGIFTFTLLLLLVLFEPLYGQKPPWRD